MRIKYLCRSFQNLNSGVNKKMLAQTKVLLNYGIDAEIFLISINNNHKFIDNDVKIVPIGKVVLHLNHIAFYLTKNLKNV